MPDSDPPGVYIEELSNLPPSIASVETAIPAFIGYTEKARDEEGNDLSKKGKRISSMLEYEKYFGGADAERGLVVTILTNGDATGRIDPDKRSKFLMYYSLQLFFANGGGNCYIISVGDYHSSGGLILDADLRAGLHEAEKINEITLLVFPDAYNMKEGSEYYSLQKEAIMQAKKLQDRFVVMDVFHSVGNADWKADIGFLRNTLQGTPDELKYAAAYFPLLRTTLDFMYKVKDSNEDNESLVLIEASSSGTTLAELKTNNNVQYNKAKNAISNIEMILPASSAVAGVYAQIDNIRGVWKAPANVNINNAIGPSVVVTSMEQDDLNIDTASGKSINVIRSFTGRGPAIIWGARTLAGNDNEWRYIPVRRFFNMVEESTRNATEQFVFEPNDLNTWTRVKSMTDNYLNQLWRAGAMQGATSREAFYVRVGLNETMTQLDILEGRMIVEVGMAIVRPAEFIILRFMHKMLQEN